jgi:hypothetical protein
MGCRRLIASAPRLPPRRAALTPRARLPARSGTIDEAEEIVAKARMWRWKPYGEVTLRTAQVRRAR